MRLQIQLSLKEMIDLRRSRRFRVFGLWTLFAGMGAGLIGIGAAEVAIHALSGGRNPAPCLFFGGVLTTVGIVVGYFEPMLFATTIWLVRRPKEVCLDFGSDGIDYSEAKRLEWITWEQVSRWYVTPQLMVLELEWNEVLAVPKRCCDSTGWSDLIALIQAEV